MTFLPIYISFYLLLCTCVFNLGFWGLVSASFSIYAKIALRPRSTFFPSLFYEKNIFLFILIVLAVISECKAQNAGVYEFNPF